MKRPLQSYLPVLTLALSLVLILPPATVRAEESLNKETAAEAIRLLSPDARVIDVQPTPVKGVYEVSVLSQGNVGIVYLDASGRYLISGALLDVTTRSNITRTRTQEQGKKFEELTRVDFSSVPLEDALVVGKKDAEHRVIVFDDPD